MDLDLSRRSVRAKTDTEDSKVLSQGLILSQITPPTEGEITMRGWNLLVHSILSTIRSTS